MHVCEEHGAQVSRNYDSSLNAQAEDQKENESQLGLMRATEDLHLEPNMEMAVRSHLDSPLVLIPSKGCMAHSASADASNAAQSHTGYTTCECDE